MQGDKTIGRGALVKPSLVLTSPTCLIRIEWRNHINQINPIADQQLTIQPSDEQTDWTEMNETRSSVASGRTRVAMR